MANLDARFGLRPVRYLGGAAYNGATIKVNISASYATALFIGDPVDFDTTIGDLATAPKYPTVMRCAFTDTTLPLGVIVSFDALPNNLTLQYNAASTARTANICLAANVVFQIRDDGTTALAKTTIGSNAVGIYTHAGDTSTGISGLELDSGTTTAPSANSSYPMLVIGLADLPDNEWLATLATGHAIWEVVLSGRLASSSGSDYGALGIVAA